MTTHHWRLYKHIYYGENIPNEVKFELSCSCGWKYPGAFWRESGALQQFSEHKSYQRFLTKEQT